MCQDSRATIMIPFHCEYCCNLFYLTQDFTAITNSQPVSIKSRLSVSYNLLLDILILSTFVVDSENLVIHDQDHIS